MKSVASFLWDIVPCTLSVEVSCFDCCGCKCLSHGLSYSADNTMPDTIVLTCATVIQQSINKIAYPLSQSRLVGEPRSEPRIPDAKLSAL